MNYYYFPIRNNTTKIDFTKHIFSFDFQCFPVTVTVFFLCALKNYKENQKNDLDKNIPSGNLPPKRITFPLILLIKKKKNLVYK